MIVTDMTHYGGITCLGPKKHRLFRLVDQLGKIVKAATVAQADEVVQTESNPHSFRGGLQSAPDYAYSKPAPKAGNTKV